MKINELWVFLCPTFGMAVAFRGKGGHLSDLLLTN
jgi:hypothetical protein